MEWIRMALDSGRYSHWVGTQSVYPCLEIAPYVFSLRHFDPASSPLGLHASPSLQETCYPLKWRGCPIYSISSLMVAMGVESPLVVVPRSLPRHHWLPSSQANQSNHRFEWTPPLKWMHNWSSSSCSPSSSTCGKWSCNFWPLREGRGCPLLHA